jgi:hypothetical protein
MPSKLFWPVSAIALPGLCAGRHRPSSANGAMLYRKHCAHCHTRQPGQASPIPSLAAYLNRSPKRSTREIKQVLREGKNSMPSLQPATVTQRSRRPGRIPQNPALTLHRPRVDIDPLDSPQCRSLRCTGLGSGRLSDAADRATITMQITMHAIVPAQATIASTVRKRCIEGVNGYPPSELLLIIIGHLAGQDLVHAVRNLADPMTDHNGRKVSFR